MMLIYIWILLYLAMFRFFTGAYLSTALVAYTVALFLYLKNRGLLTAYGISGPHMPIKDFLFFNIPVIVSVGLVSRLNLMDSQQTVSLTAIIQNLGDSQHTFDLTSIIQIIICALIEEVFFRGWLCALLEEIFFRGRLCALPEQFFFRGWLSGIFKNLSFIIISSILFAGAHMINVLNGAALDFTLLQSLWAFGMGVSFAILRVACGSIWPGTIYHVIINVSAIGAVSQMSYGHIMVTIITFMCACIMFTLYYLYNRRLHSDEALY